MKAAIAENINIPTIILKFVIIFVANIIIKIRICKFFMLNLCFNLVI